MVIVMATLSVKPESKKELLSLAQNVLATTRAEEGCISYTLLENPYDPEKCMFVEEWADLQVLKKHAASPHLSAWFKQSKPFLSAKTAMTIYQGEPVSL